MVVSSPQSVVNGSIGTEEQNLDRSADGFESARHGNDAADDAVSHSKVIGRTEDVSWQLTLAGWFWARLSR
jgi:hypothetical protein